MDASWMRLIVEQRAAKFAELAGASASVTVPLSDRLINTVVATRLPSSIRELDIRAQAGNLLLVSVRLRSPAWLPRINLKLRIERQPDLPQSPVLVLRLLSHGVFSTLAGSAAKFLNVLPPWLRMDGDVLLLDLHRLLLHYNASDVLSYLQRLEITTRDGSIVVAIDAHVPPV
jgi:hypothetical protein